MPSSGPSWQAKKRFERLAKEEAEEIERLSHIGPPLPKRKLTQTEQTLAEHPCLATDQTST